MVVTMVAMGMMKASLNQIIHMVAVWDDLMPAIWPVDVFRLMSFRPVCAFVRILRINGNHVLVHMVAMGMMQMTVVQIIHMAVMLNGSVPAIRTMNVGMMGVSCARM